METQTLIQDLAVMLTMVGLVSAVFTRFGWPKVIGYIAVGVLLGPHSFGGSFILNSQSIDVLGQLGVVFLMFALGMEFNLRKLRKVGRVAAPTAMLDMAMMMWAGHFVGTRILGWGDTQSLFLGAAISDSATTLLAKTINDLGWGGRGFTRYIFGITIVEDIFCIGLIALLTGFAVSGGLDFGGICKSMGGLTLFLVAVVVFGILAVPRSLNAVARLRDDDSLLMTLLGICFFVSLVAARLNFSLALGAFLIGTVTAEADAGRRIERLFFPLRTVFSAIFFVTVGMMVNCHSIWNLLPVILGLTALVVVGKSFNCTLGAILTGQDFKNALQTGMGLAQIGEFAYMVALIGISMKVADDSLYQVAIGVSLLTTLLNPLLMRASDPLADWLMKVLPKRFIKALTTYENWVQRFRNVPSRPENTRKMRLHFLLIFMLLLIVGIIFISAGMLSKLDFRPLSPWVDDYKRTLLWVLACLFTLPCLVFIFFRSRSLGVILADMVIAEKLRDTMWAQAFRRFTGFFVVAVAMILAFLESAMLSASIMPTRPWERRIISLLMLIIAFVGIKHIRRIGARSLMTLRNVLTAEVEKPSNDSAAELLDIHTERVIIPPDAYVVGRSLMDLKLRNRFGASVIGIERGSGCLVNPNADELLFANDRVLLLGDDAQIAKAGEFLSQHRKRSGNAEGGGSAGDI